MHKCFFFGVAFLLFPFLHGVSTKPQRSEMTSFGVLVAEEVRDSAREWKILSWTLFAVSNPGEFWRFFLSQILQSIIIITTHPMFLELVNVCDVLHNYRIIKKIHTCTQTSASAEVVRVILIHRLCSSCLLCVHRSSCPSAHLHPPSPQKCHPLSPFSKQNKQTHKKHHPNPYSSGMYWHPRLQRLRPEITLRNQLALIPRVKTGGLWGVEGWVSPTDMIIICFTLKRHPQRRNMNQGNLMRSSVGGCGNEPKALKECKQHFKCKSKLAEVFFVVFDFFICI